MATGKRQEHASDKVMVCHGWQDRLWLYYSKLVERDAEVRGTYENCLVEMDPELT
jgi:hypothetical protein